MLQKKDILDKLKVIVHEEGEGPSADETTIVHANITGYDENGKLFYSNNKMHPIRIYAGDLDYPPNTPGYLPGLVYGVLGIKRYQKRTIIIPPELAYNIRKSLRGKVKSEDVKVPTDGPGGLDLDSLVIMEVDCKYLEDRNDKK